MSLTLSGTNGVVGAGFTVDASGVSVTAGVGTFGSLAAPAAGLTGALPAISAASLTSIPAANIVGVATAGFGNASGAYSQGITMADQWRITSNLSGSGASAYITANWERNDTAGFEKIGDGMSESSGVFSFPVTGKYLIMAKCNIYSERSGVNYYQRLQIHTTQNNSSYTIQAEGYGSHAEQYTRGEMSASFIFDVTDTSTHKVKFRQYTYHGDSFILGSSSINDNNFTFIRLGDT